MVLASSFDPGGKQAPADARDPFRFNSQRVMEKNFHHSRRLPDRQRLHTWRCDSVTRGNELMRYTWIMRRRWSVWLCVPGVMMLLAACTGSHGGAPAGRATSANAAGAGVPACQSSDVSGFTRSADLADGNQLVLGRISVDATNWQPPVPVRDEGPWRYWQKRGILILAGTGPVSVSVPSSWRGRAAITYGAHGIVSSLVLTACPQPSGVWDGYVGGIYLRAVTPCVPLVFAVGDRSATVRFSVAGRCGTLVVSCVAEHADGVLVNAALAYGHSRDPDSLRRLARH
jgi:hypothetical protein